MRTIAGSLMVAALLGPVALCAQEPARSLAARFPVPCPLPAAAEVPVPTSTLAVRDRGPDACPRVAPAPFRQTVDPASPRLRDRPRTVSALATVIPTVVGVALATRGDGDGSVAGTVLNSAILWSGPLLGPAAGHVVARNPRRGAAGALLRTGIFGVAWALAPTRDFNDGFLPNPEISFGNEGSPDMGVWLAAAAAIGISALVDIAAAK